MNTSNRHRRLAGSLLIVLAVACGDDPTGPEVGTLRVSAPTSGGDLDLDGYEIVVSGSDLRWPIFANATSEVRNITPGTHTVSLEKLAPNCTVSGTHPRMVTVTAGQTVEVTFEIVCAATGIAITTRTTGVDMPITYQLTVTGQPSFPIEPNSSIVVGRLEPGTYTVALVITGEHCSVTSGGNQVTVDVSARSVTPVLFEVACEPVIRSEKIAFTVDTIIDGIAGKWIALVNPDGSGRTRLVLGDSPAWSPDGSQIVYSTTTCDFYYWYYYGCVGGLDVMDPEIGTVTTLAEGKGGFSPAWAPTGDVIAFSRWHGVGVSPDRLYTLGLDGSPAVERSPGVSALADPAWSPDGQRIAFACTFGPNVSLGEPGWDVCVANRDGTGQVRLTTHSAPEFGPAWSPDGKRIAFSRNADIVVVTLDDGTVTRLTEGVEPAWSPDGSKLVVTGPNGLFTIDANGSNRARLTTGGHHAPAWRP